MPFRAARDTPAGAADNMSVDDAAAGVSLEVAQVIEATEAEGPGRRFAIWLQGCPMRCPGCCNPEMLPVSGGASVGVDELFQRIAKASVEGVTLLGGEPFAQAGPASILAKRARAAGLSVMIFSGFTLAEIRCGIVPFADELLAHCNLLVDGRYVREEPDTSRRWVGSKNQRMHFLTHRYDPDDGRFAEPNTVEVRLSRNHGGRQLVVNGWPEVAARLLDDKEPR